MPLYRQCQIYARGGVNLDRSTLASWCGVSAYHLGPIVDRMLVHLKRSSRLFMDETRAPVLDPKAGKTKTGYLWVVTRDDRGWGGGDPPAVVFTYAPGRHGHHAMDILVGFDGVISPFLTGCIRRIHAAIFSFMAGVMPPMPIFGRSLL